MTRGNLDLWIGGTILYSMIRFAEGVGLWLEKQWAEWLRWSADVCIFPLKSMNCAPCHAHQMGHFCHQPFDCGVPGVAIAGFAHAEEAS